MGWVIAIWIITIVAAFCFGAWSQKKWDWLKRAE
jgi:hypothetical protein